MCLTTIIILIRKTFKKHVSNQNPTQQKVNRINSLYRQKLKIDLGIKINIESSPKQFFF